MAMADGFSRASGRLVACNVHVVPPWPSPWKP